MEVPTNPTRESAFVWICGSFLISANEIRISREDFFGSGTETHGGLCLLRVVQRIREDMTLRFQKQEVGSWKLEVGFSQPCTRSALMYQDSPVFFCTNEKVD